MLEHIQRDDYKPGQLFPVFNAWAVVDAFAPGSTGMLGGQDIRHASLRANFFVRLGRQPELREVNEDASG
ncbi:hypothetical protein ACFOLC_00930 [Lysobacter cavernae]|uniref:Uncharacterized protein n=1 Tax=Lysobacter cavernae TaxID=1685901 RepID=A0ABV7RIW6_9GAMM